MGRAPCCDKANVKRGPWSPEEDATLTRYLEAHGTGGNWIALPHKAGKKEEAENAPIVQMRVRNKLKWPQNLVAKLPPFLGINELWSLIASHLPGRTDNDVKNYWNTKLKKKLFGGKTGLENQKNSSNITASANYSHNPNPITTDPNCLTSSSLPSVQKTETNFSLTFWDSLTQSYESIVSSTNTQSLDLDNPVHFSLPGILDMSELGGNFINSHIVSPSQEGSSISDSSSIAMDNKCTANISLPSNNAGFEDAAAAGVLMDSGFSFPIDPVNFNGLLFQDKGSHQVASSTYYPDLDDYGYAAAETKQQGQNQSQADRKEHP
ncbi:r2r3-myb transcription factor, putative [Ricinus communis]|uniref:R2r3-myb transcription factor, putative n=1 Tax=Ricinus communis TaxID=3988 RepID=B9RRW8_RICCO|nr:r2r3-myb transcription factor, putative [Ricinus communis]